MSLTLDELRSKKEELQVAIQDLICAFRCHTGVTVRGISISHVEYQNCNMPRMQLIESGVDVGLYTGLE